MSAPIRPDLAEWLQTLTNEVEALNLWIRLLKIAETFGEAKVDGRFIRHNFMMLFDNQDKPVTLQIDKSIQPHSLTAQITVYCEGELVFDAEELISFQQREQYAHRYYLINTMAIGINSYKKGEWTDLLDFERIRKLFEIAKQAKAALEARIATRQKHQRPLREEEQLIADAFGIEM